LSLRTIMDLVVRRGDIPTPLLGLEPRSCTSQPVIVTSDIYRDESVEKFVLVAG